MSSNDGACRLALNKLPPLVCKDVEMNENSRSAIHRAGTFSVQAIACLVLLSRPASAGDPRHYLPWCPAPDCIGKWCPDDYCPKKEPCVGVSLRFGCDDYCGKKAPCVCAPLRFCCDDYCKKCPPKVCSGPLGRYLRCGSSCRPRGCVHGQHLSCTASAANPVETQQPLTAHGENQLVEEPLLAQPLRLPSVNVHASDVKLTE
jgi:hypothetical protein